MKMKPMTVSNVNLPIPPSSNNDFSSSIKEIVPSLAILLLSISFPFFLSIVNKKYIADSKIMYRIFWVGAFVLNLITVQLPGRFDGLAEKQMSDGNLDKFPWRTIFAPSGWAFSIWGIIYLSELILTIYIGGFGGPFNSIKTATPFWVLGNLFQSIWCFCFRPSFIQNLWTPMSQLALGAFSLNLAHASLTQSILTETNWNTKIILYFIRAPISLHTAWLTAATLLNLNAWAAVTKVSISHQLSLATACAYGASLLGAYLSWIRRDPLIGLTVAWALAALADRTRNNPEVTDIPAVATISLSITESILSYALIGLACVIPFIDMLTPVVQSVLNTQNGGLVKKMF